MVDQKRFSCATLLALLGLTLLLVLCDGNAVHSLAAAPARAKIRVGYSRLRISLPIFVAASRHLFEAHDLDVTLTSYETAQPMMEALVEKKVETAGYTALPITYNAILRSRVDLLFVTGMLEDQQHRISYLLRRKVAADAAHTIKSISDLRGKRIGILPTVAYKSWLNVILEANGVKPGEVVVQQIEPSLEAQTLAAGGVDALFTGDPAATAALLSGAGELITNFVEVPRYLGEPLLFGSFNIEKQWSVAHHREVQQLVASLDEAIAFINQHPAEARASLADYLPAALRNQIPHYPDARYLSSREATPDLFQKESEQYMKISIIPQQLDVRRLVIGGKNGV